jgi:PAS domain S-box-containing protein
VEDSSLFQAGATLALCSALGVYVGLQRPRSHLRGPVLAVLAAFLLWTVGLVLIRASGFQPGWSRLGIWLVFGGVMGAAPVWFFLCGQVARLPIVHDHGRALLAALLVPSALTFAALVTDPWHGQFIRGKSIEIFGAPVSQWAGPLFWVHSAWGYACTIGGIALCLRALRQSSNPTERKQLALVTLAAVLPSVSSALTMSGITGGLQLTPADLGLSSLCLVLAIVRYRFLDTSPIPASAVISELRDGLVLADAGGVVIDANPAAEALLGGELAALRGLPLAGLARRLDPDNTLERLGDTSAGHARVTRGERAFELSWGAVGGGNGRPLGHFLVVRDRTEQQRQERSLHQSQRLESLGVLAAGIAHEINNPLAFVRTNLRYLRRLTELAEKREVELDAGELAELADLAEVLAETESGVDRISAIVDATRRLTREPSGEHSHVDLDAVVAEALQLATLHAHRGAGVALELDGALPSVYGSADQLGQLLLNLLINAKQAAGPEGRIRVETRHAAGRVEVAVHDDGPGVEADVRDRIFDPFFTTKGPDEGTGLGLAIAFEFACRHEATLSVDESDLGGACFLLSLPAA